MWGSILSALMGSGGMMGGMAGAAGAGAGAGGLLGGLGAAGAGTAAAGGAGGAAGGMLGGAAGAMANPALGAAGGASTGMLSPQMLEILKSPEFKDMLGMMGQQGDGEKRPIMYPQLMPPMQGMGAQGMFRPYSHAPQGLSFGGY